MGTCKGDETHTWLRDWVQGKRGKQTRDVEGINRDVTGETYTQRTLTGDTGMTQRQEKEIQKTHRHKRTKLQAKLYKCELRTSALCNRKNDVYKIN